MLTFVAPHTITKLRIKILSEVNILFIKVDSLTPIIIKHVTVQANKTYLLKRLLYFLFKFHNLRTPIANAKKSG